MLRQVRQLAPLAAALALAACQKQEPAPTPAPPPAAPSAVSPEAKGDGDAFELEMTASAAEESGELLIRLAAKPGYKINAEYPHNFRPEKDSSVQFEQPKFDLTAGEKTPCEKKAEDTCRLEAKVPFKAAKGEHKAAGIAAFSVCNDEVCLIEKIPLQTTVSVN